MITNKEIMVELSAVDKEEYEIMEKVLHLAYEFDKELEHMGSMEIFCSSNDSFILSFKELILPMLLEGKKIIAFGTYNAVVKKVYDALINLLPVEYPIHQFSGQLAQRKEIVETFNSYTSGALLISTNALNRGFKIEGNNVVFHLDIPNSLNTFTQRNRRGLNGEEGKIFTLISKDTMHEKKYEMLKKQQQNIDQLTK